jgi:diguanylate cyclase (GGDEF)-like protein/PAS domain S-box-containing protein
VVLEITGRSLPDGGFVTTFSDISARRSAEHALQESERRFRLLAEHSGDVVVLATLDGLHLYLSPASGRVLGWTAAELVGRYAREFVHPGDLAWFDAAAAAMREGALEARGTYRHRRPDGTWMWVEAHARVHRELAGGASPGYVATLRDATERKHAEAELLNAYQQMKRMALTDALTGIANRRSFETELAIEWGRCGRQGAPLSLLLLDVDHFKRYNDRYGHMAGDKCLQRIAGALVDVARRSSDHAARIGGEEFAMLAPNTDADGVLIVAERLRVAILDLGMRHEANTPLRLVTSSIGVTTMWPHGVPTAEVDQLTSRLFSAADNALYRAKSTGRNRVVAMPAELRPGSKLRASMQGSGSLQPPHG